MKNCIWFFVQLLSRAILSLRYRIEVKGLETLGTKNQRLLFLANHTAYFDPLVLFARLYGSFHMRPLIVESMYKLPILGFFSKKARAIPIPDFDTSVNQFKVRQAQIAVQKTIDGLKAGDNFTIFPSGRLKSQGKEVIGATSSAYDIIQALPDLDVVMVRITGFWGSIYSKAITHKSPDPATSFKQGLSILLRNGIFFAPRRKITIELSFNPPSLDRKGSRLDFNRSLESWFNHYRDERGSVSESEPLQLVSYAFWKTDLPVISPQNGNGNGTHHPKVSIPPEIETKVYTEIRKILGNPNLEIQKRSLFTHDLGMDSLNIAELIVFCCHKYGLDELHPEDFDTVESLLTLIVIGKKKNGAATIDPSKKKREEYNRPLPQEPTGKTLPQAFLNVSWKMRPFIALADDTTGEVSYAKARQAVLVLAQYFRSLPEEKIAIMLPSSAGAFLSILAVQTAGKVPVLLNWTLGPRYLEKMMEISCAKRVITSRKFVERLSHVDFGNLVSACEFLEEIRSDLTLKMKLLGATLAHLPTQIVQAVLGLSSNELETAIILFTSGTENNPKGVPLSHKNILSNIHQSVDVVSDSFQSDEAMFDFLPPFHSFGFTASGFMPLLSGIRVICAPDPTDSIAVASCMERWKPTILCTTPAFLKNLLQVAAKEQIQSLRWIFIGGEKAPPDLHERVDGILLLEGYGATECSPIISIRRLDRPIKGVGQVLKWIETLTIHPETLKRLAAGAEGEICVRGPNVFSGYLGTVSNPFIQIDGEEWYRTGDIGRIEEDGTIHITGRLKRFTKIGGEMISLGAVEETLISELQKTNSIEKEKTSLALCVDERVVGSPQLILFSTIALEKEHLNELLHQAGFSRLIKISSVQRIEEIPLMGTGKTNYRALQSLIA